MLENPHHYGHQSYYNNRPYDKASYYRKHLEKKSKKDQIMEGKMIR